MRTMQTVEVAQPGGPEMLRLSERLIPSPGRGEVLVRVGAAGLNHADLAQRAGFYPLPPGTTDILGLEVAGEIAQVGPGVEAWKEGDRVCALLVGGGYSEFAVAPAVQCLPIPRRLDFAEAAVLPEAFSTVWLNVFHKADLRASECLLVHGGSSGVGIAAIQLATALGSKVFCTAGTDDKCRVCEAQGASRAINYRTEDFERVLLEGEGKQFIDVVLDMIGGDYFPKNMKVLARGGRLVYISSLAGRRVELDLVDMMRKRLTLFGSVLRPLPVDVKGAVLEQMADVVWPLLERKVFTPLIHERFPFDKASEAHRLMEAHQHVGKVVLTW